MAAQAVFKHLNDVAALRRTLAMFENAHTIKNKEERTPLHVAAATGNLDAVRELLRAKASHEVMDKDGSTPLHLAAEGGFYDVVAELLTGFGRKTAVKSKNKEGRTALHLAAKGGHVHIVGKLLESGARTDSKDKAGAVPLDLVPNPTENELLVQVLMGTATAPPPPAPTPSTPTQGSGIPASPPTLAAGFAPGVHGNAEQSPAPPLSARGAGGARTSFNFPPGTLQRAAKQPATPHGSSNATPLTARERPATGKAGAHAAAGSPVGSTMALHMQEAALQALTGQVKELEARLEETQSKAAVAEHAEAAQREMSAQLGQAMELIQAQARRLEDLESRLAFSEERGREARARLDRAEDTARDAAAAEAKRQQEQDAAFKALQTSLSSMVTDQQAAQSSLQELSQQLAKLATGGAKSSSGGGATVSQGDGLSGSVAKELQGELASVRAQLSQLRPLPERADELTLQVSQLSAGRATLAGELEAMRSRIGRLEDVGVADRLDLLQLKVTQASQTLATLSSGQEDMTAQLTALMRWKGEVQQRLLSLSDGGAAPATAASSSGGGAADAAAAGNIKALEISLSEQGAKVTAAQESIKALEHQVSELKQALAASQAHASAPATPMAPSTPSAHGLGAFSEIRVSTAKRHAMAAADTAGMEELSSDVAALRAEVGDFKASLDEARAEVRTSAAGMRREWETAVAEAGRRFAEQNAEMEAREARVKAMRDSVLREEESRAAVATLQTRVEELETGLGLLQHKVEVLEESVVNLASPSRFTSRRTTQADPMASPTVSSPTGNITKHAPGPVGEESQQLGVVLSPDVQQKLTETFEAMLSPGRSKAASPAAARSPADTSRQEQHQRPRLHQSSPGNWAEAQAAMGLLGSGTLSPGVFAARLAGACAPAFAAAVAAGAPGDLSMLGLPEAVLLGMQEAAAASSGAASNTGAPAGADVQLTPQQAMMLQHMKAVMEASHAAELAGGNAASSARPRMLSEGQVAKTGRKDAAQGHKGGTKPTCNMQ